MRLLPPMVIKFHPRRDTKPYKHLAFGFSHPSRLLAASRSILQSAKRRARFPMTLEFFVGPRKEPLEFDKCRPFRMLWPRKTQMPWKLFCPANLPEIDVGVVYPYMPGLAGFSLKTIKKALAEVDYHMWGRLTTPIFVEPPLAAIPKELEMVMPESSASTLPTHILAAFPVSYSHPCSPSDRITWRFRFRRDIMFYPVHAVPFLAHCTKFPPVPISSPRIAPIKAEQGRRMSVKLPVIPLRLPNIDDFPIVMQYFYTYNWRQFGYNLVPISMPDLQDDDPIPEDPYSPFFHKDTIKQAVSLANKISSKTLVSCVLTIRGVYYNMLALGVNDKKMWQVLCFCWDVLKMAEELQRQRDGIAVASSTPELKKAVIQVEKGKLKLLPPRAMGRLAVRKSRQLGRS